MIYFLIAFIHKISSLPGFAGSVLNAGICVTSHGVQTCGVAYYWL